jgi:hypothetical protein
MLPCLGEIVDVSVVVLIDANNWNRRSISRPPAGAGRRQRRRGAALSEASQSRQHPTRTCSVDPNGHSMRNVKAFWLSHPSRGGSPSRQGRPCRLLCGSRKPHCLSRQLRRCIAHCLGHITPSGPLKCRFHDLLVKVSLSGSF